MLSFLYVYSHHSILECYNLFSGVELSMRSFFVICSFMISHELGSTDISTTQHLPARGLHVYSFLLEVLDCDRSILVNVTTNKFVGLKCLTEAKTYILYDHVDHTRFHIVDIGCQMVQLLSADNFGPTMFINLTSAIHTGHCDIIHTSCCAI